ncbi:MAG: response regulator [Candidatus Saccharimonas sp.]|nr:response regulator [Planctomycetaceae bacterium]
MFSAQQFEGSSPTRRLHILYLEDSHADATLVEATLAESGLDFELKCVETEAEFQAALQQGSLDVILSDYRLPSFDGMAALELARFQLPEVPFIFVSGGIGEERAIETLKAGATDYVLKDRLKRLVPSVERAVREAAERAERVALAAENERLHRMTQEASQRKDEFLAMLAHELRNPLGAILGAAQLIDKVAHDKEAVIKADEIIQRQGQHMVRLLDDLLDVARVTQGKIALRQELVDLTDLVDDAVAAVRPHITARQQDFSVEIADAPFYVLGDATRLEQVQVNLLTNASRYSASNEQIRLRLTREGDQAVLSVRDTGLGIAPEMLDRIFDLFVQSDETFDRSAGGLGVGLTLVRSLVEMHGGQVTAHSAGLGFGSEFVVRLPLVSAPKAAPPQKQPIPSGQPRHRILLVEDNVDSREMLKDLLELDGHEVQTAEDGIEGTSIVETGWPDLVLMDIGLPGLSGYDTARLIRANGHRDLHLVALTGYGQPADRQSALEAGFDDHLVKPFNPADLTRILSRKQNKLSAVTL